MSFEILDFTMGQHLPTKNFGKEQELRTAHGPVNQQKFVQVRNCAQNPLSTWTLDFCTIFEHIQHTKLFIIETGVQSEGHHYRVIHPGLFSRNIHR